MRPPPASRFGRPASFSFEGAGARIATVYPTQEPEKETRHGAGQPAVKPILRLLCLILATTVLLAACDGGSDLSKTLSSENGLEMRVPDSWSEDSTLNPGADLQASNREAESYVVVISDLKRDLVEGVTLEEFGDFAVEQFIAGLNDPDLSFSDLDEPEPVESSGLDGLRYEVSASPGELDLSYLFTVIESSDRFIQVIAWTERPRMDEQRQTLEAISDSVTQT